MTLTFVTVLAAALLVGVLIGCVGVGGVLLPPTLVYLGGLGFHAAAATSTWAFLFCGAAGTLSYSGRRSIDWRMAAWLGAGVVPTAVAGAWANAALPEGLLMAILAALMVLTGSDALLRGSPADAGGRRLGAPALLAVGAFVGFGSALTGTGGAVLLVPVLLLLRTPVLAAVGAAQAVSLPVVIFSTAGYLLYGSVHYALGTVAGLVGAVGVVAGARIAHTVRAVALRRVVATALLCAGLLIAARMAWGAMVDGSTGASDAWPTPHSLNVGPEAHKVHIEMVANDSGESLEIDKVKSGQAHGDIICDAEVETGKLRSCDYTPMAGFSGKDEFSYIVKDASGKTDSAKVYVRVKPAN